ncbi:hypothetical protein niasHS_002764 [Heterodera schachtii]|uniref:HTH CENPB-type domain-containing protein n=1 Tax=Heterodera schachtii TaxID=97005 RepID=A0ABD2K2J9_HETSC
MDLFSVQSMINNGECPAADPCFSSSSSSPSSNASLHFRLPPPALSPFEFPLGQMPTSSSSYFSSSPGNAFLPSLLPSAASAVSDLLQVDPELLQSLAHQLGTFSPSFFGTASSSASSSFPSSSSNPSSASPPLNALLLVLLQQQFRALSNGQSGAAFPSVLPLCVPPDFRPLFPADWTTKDAAANALNCFTTMPSSEQQQQMPFSDFSASSSGSCSGSVEHSPGGASKAFGGGTAHRLSYPREFKLLVLKSFWANGQNKYRTCKEFQITKSMLNGWLQKADRIRRSRPGSLKSGRSGRRPQFPKIEQQLFELVQHQLTAGERASNKWIRKMAKKLTTAGTENANGKRMKEDKEKEGEKERMDEEQRGEDREAEGGKERCQFSERWLNNFKRRYGIQTTMEGTVNAEGDEETEDDEAERERRGGDTILVEAISPPLSPCPIRTTDELWQNEEQWRSIAWEICASNDRLPIQAFYDRFPKVLQQTNGGKRERNGAKNGH